MDPLLPIKEGRKIIAWKRVGRCWTLFSEEFREPGMPHLIDIMGAPADLRRVAMVCGALGISLERYRGRKGDFGGMEGWITSADLQRLRPFLRKIGLPYRDVFDVILPADAA